nr:immunoglobulin heavy chain junction region [Mus musculus]MBK4196857.1 immunoglobulin heavy chain junction region [Mus musculus]
CARPFMDYW